MGIIGGSLGYKILNYLSPASTGNNEYTAYQNKSKMEVLFGANVWEHFKDKVVIDFGCETGIEAVEIAQHGARKVIGVDLYENSLRGARERAKNAGVGDRCEFTTKAEEKADVIMTLDTFEHFSDPAAILKIMRGALKDDGYVLTCFGPTWYHPLGGHGFSIFPWAHLVFTEKALIRWYNDLPLKDYGDYERGKAKNFTDVRGGLNQLTIRRFEKIVSQSDFRIAEFEARPIRKLKPIANRLTREFTTAIVQCKLVPK